MDIHPVIKHLWTRQVYLMLECVEEQTSPIGWRMKKGTKQKTEQWTTWRKRNSWMAKFAKQWPEFPDWCSTAHYQKWWPSCVRYIRIFLVDFCLVYRKKCCNSMILLYLFDVIIKISAINCCIEFITVMNYVKAITSNIMSQGMKWISLAFLRISLVK